MKIRLRMISFFCQSCRTQISSNKFSRVSLFDHFYSKIDSSAHFYSFFNIGWFNRKTKNIVRFSIKKNIHKLYAFTMKTDFRNMSESRKFRQKTEQNRLKVSNITPFFFKKLLLLLKNKKH